MSGGASAGSQRLWRIVASAAATGSHYALAVAVSSQALRPQTALKATPVCYMAARWVRHACECAYAVRGLRGEALRPVGYRTQRATPGDRAKP